MRPPDDVRPRQLTAWTHNSGPCGTPTHPPCSSVSTCVKVTAVSARTQLLSCPYWPHTLGGRRPLSASCAHRSHSGPAASSSFRSAKGPFAACPFPSLRPPSSPLFALRHLRGPCPVSIDNPSSTPPAAAYGPAQHTRVGHPSAFSPGSNVALVDRTDHLPPKCALGHP